MPTRKTSDNELLDKIERYCTYQERCRKDVTTKLKKLGVKDEKLRGKLLKKLEQNGYLNEARYAKFFTRDNFNLNCWGKVKISLALQQKGISTELIEKGLNEIDPKEYVKTLRIVLRKKESELSTLQDPFITKNRIANYLTGKGFEADLIWLELGSD